MGRPDQSFRSFLFSILAESPSRKSFTTTNGRDKIGYRLSPCSKISINFSRMATRFYYSENCATNITTKFQRRIS